MQITYAIADNLSALQVSIEEAALAKSFASQKRAESFLLGRTALRLAASKLSFDLSKYEIGRNSDGSIILPKELTGSVAHTTFNDRTLAVAAVAFAKDYTALGIDLEHKKRLVSERALKFLYREANLNKVRVLVTRGTVVPITLYCLKEAAYKNLAIINKQQGLKTKLRYKDIIIDQTSTVEKEFNAHWQDYKLKLSLLGILPDYVVVISKPDTSSLS